MPSAPAAGADAAASIEALVAADEQTEPEGEQPRADASPPETTPPEGEQSGHQAEERAEPEQAGQGEGEGVADPLQLAAAQCDDMLGRGARQWDLGTIPAAACDELARTLRAALRGFEHSVYLSGMVEHAFSDETGFHETPPPRALVLVLRRACREFASVRGEEEAFRVVAEYNRLGGDYAPDPEQPASESQPSQSTDAPLEEAAAEPAAQPSSPRCQDSLTKWMVAIGLGHLEGALHSNLYGTEGGEQFSGPQGLQSVQSLDGDDMDDVIEMLGLGEEDTATFRREIVKLSRNPAHNPSASKAPKGNMIPGLKVLQKTSSKRSEGDKAWDLGKAAFQAAQSGTLEAGLQAQKYEEAVKHLTAALEKGTDHRSEALIERGLAYAEMEKHQEAFDDFDVLCAEDPTNSYAFNNRGWKHMHFERYEEAKEDLMKALDLNPNNTHAQGNFRGTLEKLYGAAASDGEARTAIRASSNNQAKSETGFVGLANQGATCYLNSLLQTLYMTPELRRGLYDWKYDKENYEAVDKCIPAQLQRLFVQLQTSDARAIETEALTKSFGWTDMQAFEQQDVQEMFKLLTDALETKFKDTPQAGLIESLYTGTVKDYVRCRACGYESARNDSFTDLMVTIQPFGETENIKSLEEGLGKSFQSEVLDGANQYFCERCNAKKDADKGARLSKVPYIMTVNLKRFDYDWERDCRCKIDGMVTFPFELNMAPFLEPEPEPEPEPESEPESASAGEASPGPEVVNRGFGKDKCEILARGASAIRVDEENPAGALDYELYSILVHSGGALGGHYYSYTKDLKTKRWMHFNDDEINEVSEEEVRAAYGGESTASAYMLQYRRIESEANLDSVEPEDVPEQLLAEMSREFEEAKMAKEERQKESERRRHTCTLYLYCGDKLVQLEVDKRTKFGVFKDQVAEQFDLVEEFQSGQARLCMLHTMHDMPTAVLDAEDDTVLEECKLELASGCGDVLVQLRPELPAGAPAVSPIDPWDFTYGPESEGQCSSSTLLRVVLNSIVMGDPSSAGADCIEQRDDSLGQLAVKAVANCTAMVRFREGSTIADLRKAIVEVFALPIENARVVHSGYDGNRLVQDRDLLLLPKAKVFNGDTIFVRDLSHKPPRPIPVDEESRLIDSLNCIHIHYTAVNGSDYVHYLRVPKNIASKALFAKIGGVLQVQPRQLRVLDHGYETKRTPHRRRNRLTCKTSDETAKVPILLWKGSEHTSDFLFHMTVRENWLVTELKAEMAAKLKAEKGLDIDPACMRIREIDGSVFLDSQTVLEAVVRFAGQEKFGVNALAGPETKSSKSDVVVTCVRWYPAEYRLGEPGELVIDDHAQAVELRQAILALPEAAGLTAEGMGLTKRPHSWQRPSPLDAPGMMWDQDRAKPTVDNWGYTRRPDLGIGWPKDGDAYYYRDNSEELKELSEEERAELEKEAKKQTARSTTYLQEQGVRIHVEQGRGAGGAGVAGAAPPADEPADGAASLRQAGQSVPLSLVTAAQDMTASLQRSNSNPRAWSSSSDDRGNVSDDEEAVASVVALGFADADARSALRRHGSADAAANALLAGDDETSPGIEAWMAESAAAGSPSSGTLESLEHSQ